MTTQRLRRIWITAVTRRTFDLLMFKETRVPDVTGTEAIQTFPEMLVKGPEVE